VLLNILKRTAQLPTKKNCLAQNVNSAKVEKPLYKRNEYTDYELKMANLVKYVSMDP